MIGRILRGTLRRVLRTAYPYGATRRVLRGPARGGRFVVAPGMELGYALGTPETMCRELMALVRPGTTVYDVGANQGQMALAFGRLVGPTGRVLAFEPAPAVAAAMERNVELTGLRNVHVRCAAVSDHEGVATFLFDAVHSTHGKLRDVEPGNEVAGQPIEVPLVTLDALSAAGEVPSLIKIDVEGAGACVLRGAAALLGRPAPHAPVVYIEIHGSEEQAGVRDHLLALGYEARTLDGQVVADPTARWSSPLICRKVR